MNNPRIPRRDADPDGYFTEDIRRLYELSRKDRFDGEYYAINTYKDQLQFDFKLKTSLSVGSQFLIQFEDGYAIGEIYRIDDNRKEEQYVYVKIIKKQYPSQPELGEKMQPIKVISLNLIHYSTEVYAKILSCLKRKEIKNAMAESRTARTNFQIIRRLLSGLMKKPSILSIVYGDDDPVEEVKNAIRKVYDELKTCIICTPSTDKLFELAVYCNNNPDMSKQTIVFPPQMFLEEKWRSESVRNIKIHDVDYNMNDGWDIEKLEHELKRRNQDAKKLMEEVHPRIILGTPASLISIMDGIKAYYVALPTDRPPRQFIFDEGDLIPDVFALILLTCFPLIDHITVFHEVEEKPVKFGLNTGSLATMSK